ncbi:hypothetical protein [Hymenobacter frigidus]|uniref:hypothetical protein n=1 Tax=Hymenobacter frigidus TaxID=1524095 RepID=UPI00357103AD
MNDFKFILERYTGRTSRYPCPSCEKPHQFTRYLNVQTGEPVGEGCNSKLRAVFFISHRYRPLCIAEGIRHRSDFLIGEGPRSFELHP